MPIFPRPSNGGGDVIYLSEVLRVAGLVILALCLLEVFLPGFLSKGSRENTTISLPVVIIGAIFGLVMFITGQVMKNKGF